ncbi:MAG: hypothetical protein Q9195_004938 [Heterodermia aff. obscurata]
MATTSKASSLSQPASARYVREFHALLEHQREVFDKERALWEIERSDLHDQILLLQKSLREFQNGSSSQATSPVSGSRYVGSGKEFWRGTGGKGDTQPTRTFSSPEQSNGNAKRLASISEHPSPHRSTAFDGINFRQAGHAPSIATEVAGSQSPSPSRIANGKLRLSTFQLAPPTDYVIEHAGHTPLVRDLADDTDGTSSAVSNRAATPAEIQEEKPSVEPHAPSIKPPSERSDSYFTGILAETLEDPAMSGPLGLGDDNTSEDKSFLNQVNMKLKEAAGQVQNNTEEPDILVDPPESEPRLRIKRSMNFGSQLGGSKVF